MKSNAQFLGGYVAKIHSTAATSVMHCTTAEAELGMSGPLRGNLGEAIE
jgi:hypothetical protein